MSLNKAHQGYEYQDLLTTYFILDNILNDEECTFLIDKKNSQTDRFDDLTIITKTKTFKKQIKYSSAVVKKRLSKKDLSSDVIGLALDELFNSWKSTDKNIELRLCLAWDKPNDELLDILKQSNVPSSFKEDFTNVYNIDITKFWQEKSKPKENWKRFLSKYNNIDRAEFVLFCDNLIIETDFPKISFDIYNPSHLEKLVLKQVDELGIGIFPNNKIKKEEFILGLNAWVKKCRSDHSKITTKDIYSKFNIRTDYGSIEQVFPINSAINLSLDSYIESVISKIFTYRKLLLTGEPGGGKSWFVENLIHKLEEQKIASIKHYCYTDIEDENQKDRIKIDVFYGNLVSELLEVYPELKKYKTKKFASNLNEFNILISKIQEPTVLIVDGLDHIQRVHKYHSYTDLNKKEIHIINELNKIECNKNVSILVTSQPIEELSEIVGFQKDTINSWSIKEVKALMMKLNLNDEKISNVLLSDLLLDKSQGNPLYLTYLIHEIKSTKEISISFLEKLPAYSFNLKNYYEYLVNDVKVESAIPQILSGVNFYLKIDEINEITNLGTLVNKTIKNLLPILKQNHSLDGYIIYHESFRRFIFEFYKSKGVDTNKVIFDPVIKWFGTKNFYTYSKAYRYYLKLLIDTGKLKKVAKFISGDFVNKSIYAGQSWELLKINYHYLLNALESFKSMSKYIIFNEISNVIQSTEDTYQNVFDLYISAMSGVYGFKKVSESLVFNSKTTLPFKKGLEVCYILDTNNEVAPWDLYISYYKKGDKIELEELNIYIRYLLSSNKTDTLVKLAEEIILQNIDDAIAIFRSECLNFERQYINLIVKESTVLNDIIFPKMISTKIDPLLLTAQVLELEYVFDKEIVIINTFIDQIKLQVNDNNLLEIVIEKFKNINWFYNWLIYYIKLIQIKNQESYSFTELKIAFNCLILDLELFKGKPRTTDLYQIEKTIYSSLNEGLKLLKNKKEWDFAISVIDKISNETTSEIKGSIGGPLSTEKFFNLLSENLNDYNVEYILNSLLSTYNDKKYYQFYEYLSKYCFQISKVYSFLKDTKKAKKFYRLGVDNMLAYTFSRDLTLEEITKSIESYSSIDLKSSKKYVRKVRDLAYAVDSHTDGKDTKHFPVEWFENYYNINPKEATIYLLNELLKCRVDWRLESSLQYFLVNTKSKNHKLLAILHQTLLVNNNEDLLNSAINVSENLLENDLKSSLLNSIKTRVAILKKNDKYSNEFVDKINNLIIDNDIVKVEYKKQYSKDIYPKDLFHQFKMKVYRTKEFSKMPVEELTLYLKDYRLQLEDINSLSYFFENQKELNTEIKDIIQILIRKNTSYSDWDNIDLSFIFNCNSDISVYFWSASFVIQKDGWFNNLSNVNALEKAYEINPKKAIEYLFELLPKEFKTKDFSTEEIPYHRAFSANLYNALVKVNYKQEDLKKVWITLYNSIDSRFPSKSKFDWKTILLNEFDLNIDELLVCFLIVRFKSGTTQKNDFVLSHLSVLLYDNSSLLIKPLKWFFKNKDYFPNTVVAKVLELLRIFNKTEPTFKMNFNEVLLSYYPTKHYFIDYIIELFYDVRVNIIENISLITYPTKDIDIDFFVSWNETLEIIYEQIDISDVVGYYIANHRKETDLDLYWNRGNEIIVQNNVVSDYLLNLINTMLYNNLRLYPNQDDVYNNIKIDIKTIIAQTLSNSIRPTNLKKASEYIEEEIQELPLIDNGWCRIAHYEKELINAEVLKFNESKIYGGLSFNKQPFYNRISKDEIWDSRTRNSLQSGIIAERIKQHFLDEKCKFLWLNSTILKELNLTTIEFHKGLKAINEKKEIVLKLNTWQTDFISSSFHYSFDSEIPKLDGVELLIREDYYFKITKLFKEDLTYSIIRK